MDSDPRALRVRIEADGLHLTRGREAGGVYYVLPGADAVDGATALPLAEALHARIRPVGSAEAVLRGWTRGAPPPYVAFEDPAAREPVRVRAGAIVIRDGRILLIRFTDEAYYEIPGGGVEAGESPQAAAVRELREESGLAGAVVAEVARIWKDGRREHYFTLDAEGELGPPETLDTYGGIPVWVPVEELPRTPVWPRHLAWRIAHWHRTGPPARPAELADSVEDLRAPCDW
ncbi:NUDIX domain-containing protein [Streptomyces sp. NBC_01343]|uniref:NUDIX domain-containing protein n=1 Tax=Streptomyces sp. NBC_01343 TaxID=2903832 RepID=UPI002E105BC4|nr:NUDIX domain-containing protein [Streptomyces sp. NBC_01343]